MCLHVGFGLRVICIVILYSGLQSHAKQERTAGHHHQIGISGQQRGHPYTVCACFWLEKPRCSLGVFIVRGNPGGGDMPQFPRCSVWILLQYSSRCFCRDQLASLKKRRLLSLAALVKGRVSPRAPWRLSLLYHCLSAIQRQELAITNSKFFFLII